MRRKVKKNTLGYWKKLFWVEFSKYIRKRDDYKCFTCEGAGNQAGHFIARSIGGMSLFFHERNVHAQCLRCNIFLSGNGAIYYRKMIERYGQESVDELFELKDRGYRKYSIEEYQELIEEYKLKVEQLNELL